MSPFDPRVILRPILLALPIVFASILTGKENPPPPPPPIRALLVTGGCSHEYPIRQEILTRGIRERVVRPIEWVVRLQGAGEGDARIPLFESPDWAKDYDIVVHDHCFPRVTDPTYVDRVLAPHRAGLPALLLHGTMMSFRTGDERWFEFTGLTTRAHERERAIRVEALAPADPVLKGFAPWEIPREELYRVETAKSGIVALTRSLDPAGLAHVTSWTHHYGPARARVFGTTLGNATATLADARYLDLVARGFLWSLGELSGSSFVPVALEDSLKGLSIEVPAAPTLRPGRNSARQGAVSAFSWGADADPAEAILAIDGDPNTAWIATTPGPGSLVLHLGVEEKIGVVAVFWHGMAPPEAVLEGTSDGRSWFTLATLMPPASKEHPVLARFEARKLAGLRLNVPRTDPGNGVALREIAAYPSEGDLPSAILAAVPDPPGFARYRTAGEEGDLSGIRLLPGWRVEFFENTGLQGVPGQLLPSASGSLFVSLFPDHVGAGSVHRIEKDEREGFVKSVFLSGIARATRIAWDGEWLYTLSGHRLERVRKALGPGPADERQRLSSLFHLADESASGDLAWTDLRLADDGWLVGQYRAVRPATVLTPAGRPVTLASEGCVRFRRDGSGFATSDRGVPSPSLRGAAEIDGVIHSERDGSRIWFVATRGDDLWLGRLASIDGVSSPGVDLNEVPTAKLSGLLSEAPREAARREIALELARRKCDPLPELKPLLAESPPTDLAEVLVAAVAAVPTPSTRIRLIELAGSGRPPSVRSSAFRALGDFRGDLDPGVFRDLGSVVDPPITAAIFEGMRRRGATLPGAESIALRLSHHPDSGLARAAFLFLIDTAAVETAFAALDADAHREDWPRAFDLLAEFPTSSVVDEIVGRLAATRDPDLRHGLLDTLCRLQTLPGGEPWAKSGEIELLLHRFLVDRRVDRAGLLFAMEQNRVPLNRPEILVGLAAESPSFDAYVIERLTKDRPVLPDQAKEWLGIVANDPARDGDLRRSARVLLGVAPESNPEIPFRVGEGTPGQETDGKGLFRSLGCAVCHNLDGEGLSVGPDLVARIADLDDSETAKMLLEPASSPTRLETQDGRSWTGWIEDRTPDVISLRDLAGNLLFLDRAEVKAERRASDQGHPCSRAGELGLEFVKILSRYLQGLGNP